MDNGGGENRGGRLLELVGISSGSTESMSRGCMWPRRTGRVGRFKNAKYAVEGGEKGACKQSSASRVEGDAIDVLRSRDSGAIGSSAVIVLIVEVVVVAVVSLASV